MCWQCGASHYVARAREGVGSVMGAMGEAFVNPPGGLQKRRFRQKVIDGPYFTPGPFIRANGYARAPTRRVTSAVGTTLRANPAARTGRLVQLGGDGADDAAWHPDPPCSTATDRAAVPWRWVGAPDPAAACAGQLGDQP